MGGGGTATRPPKPAKYREVACVSVFLWAGAGGGEGCGVSRGVVFEPSLEAQRPEPGTLERFAGGQREGQVRYNLCRRWVSSSWGRVGEKRNNSTRREGEKRTKHGNNDPLLHRIWPEIPWSVLNSSRRACVAPVKSRRSTWDGSTYVQTHPEAAARGEKKS